MRMRTTIPVRALYIWKERPDLQDAFDLRRRSGRERLIWWYLRHGFAEYGLEKDANDEACIRPLHRRYPRAKTLSYLPITWLMNGFVAQSPFDQKDVLSNPVEQKRFLDWFFAVGLTQRNLTDFLSADQAKVLVEVDIHAFGLPRLMQCIWSHEPKLRSRFNGLDDPAFHRWCIAEGAREYPILAHPLIGLAPKPARRSHAIKPFGVNLFGHASGRSGVSEDVRMAAQVLKLADIPFQIRNVSTGSTMPEEERIDVSGGGLPYAINLFCMPAPNMVSAAIQAGPYAVADCYNIGFWPWELSEVPDFWRHAYDYVDEIWASSRFTYDAFCRSSPKPVRYMPFAVSAAESDRRQRKDFQLPNRKFLFGFAFDALSSLARKAPLLTVRAFQQAFPADPSVGLVIKGMRVSDHSTWSDVISAIGSDDRIHLITESLPRGSLLDLWRSLDCFVSLHRSEGFGRNIAETMLLGKPVIVTGHSGNMDFTRFDTAALVPCSLRPVKEGEYPFGTGQLWAEPDVLAAARQMQKIVRDSEWRGMLSRAGKNEIEKRYSFGAVAADWAPILKETYRHFGSVGDRFWPASEL